MKVYACDGCGSTIKDAHGVRMREYFYDAVYESGSVCPWPTRRKLTVHLCGDCFHGLKVIAEKVAGGKDIL